MAILYLEQLTHSIYSEMGRECNTHREEEEEEEEEDEECMC
jgi:hypothetical protein